MNKLTTPQEAVSRIEDGNMILVGGFLQGGCPETLLGAVADFSKAENLTTVSCSCGVRDGNFTRLLQTGRVKYIKTSYVGNNPESSRMMVEEPERVELSPQGTLAERIRAGGAGLGGVLTPVGIGTLVEEGKEKMTVDGREYLFEKPIRADVALVWAQKADTLGNLFMPGSTKNYGALMPPAARYVIAEAEEIVEPGEIDPELVTVPGIFVHAIVKAGE